MSQVNERIGGLHKLVSKMTTPSSHFKLQLLATLIAAVLIASAFCASSCQAKIHHSKRQAPNVSPQQQQQQQQQQQTGRENTNWWNLWWQQYINEAVQPTVRPVVSVSFDGRSINLNDQAASESASGLELENSVLGSPEILPADIERFEKMRLVASSALVSNRQQQQQQEDKQQLLMQRKSIQQQERNWNSVRPTMIQMQPSQEFAMAARDARTNRQASMFQTSEDEQQQQQQQQVPFQSAIQMRNEMQKASVAQTQRQLNSPVSNLIYPMSNERRRTNGQQQLQQRPIAAPANQINEDQVMKFEQQQNQMIDYSEDNEPDMENNVGGLLGMDAGANEGRPGDSSSSSMMQPEQPARPAQATSGSSGSSSGPAPSGAGQQPRPSTEAAPATAGPQPSSPSTPRPQQTSSGRPAQLPVASSTQAPGRGSQVTGKTGGPQQTTQGVQSTQTPATTSTTTTTTTTTATATATSTKSPGALQFDTNETPISIEGEREPKMSTPSTGRVELKNGKPASGFRQQQASTNSARLPTKPTTKMTTASQEPSTTPTSTTVISDNSTRVIVDSSTLAPEMQPKQSTISSSPEPAVSQPSMQTEMAPGQTGDSKTTTATAATQATSSPSSSSAGPTRGQQMDVGQQQTSMAGTSTTTSSPPSGAPANGTSASTTPATTTTSGEEETEEGEEEENEASTGSNAPSSPESETNDTESDDSVEETEEGEEPSSTTKPMAMQNTTSSKLQQQSPPTRPSQPSTAFVTMDLERLPKGMSAMDMVMQTNGALMTPPATATTATTGARQQAGSVNEMNQNQEDFARLKPTAEDGQTATPSRPSQQPASDFVMMTLDPGRATIDGDTAITVPMDALMKMVMNQIAQDEREQAQMTGRMQGADGEQQRMPTTARPASTRPSDRLVEQEQTSQMTTASPPTTTITSAPELAKTTSKEQKQEQATQASSRGETSTMKMKKLQPPPTTQNPSMVQSSAMFSEDMNRFSPDQMSGGSTRGEMAPVDQMGARMSTPPMAMPDESTSSTPARIQEPKIELINLDLMPIQRIMTQADRMMQTRLSTAPATTATSPRPAQGEQTRENPKTQQQAQDQQSSLFIEVEPGMRLRPSTSVSQSQSQQQMGPSVTAVSGIQQPNTVYMLMMNGPGTEAHSKKPGVTGQAQTGAPQRSAMPTRVTMSTSAQSARQTTTASGQPSSTRTTPPAAMGQTMRGQQQQQTGPSAPTTPARPTQATKTSGGSTSGSRGPTMMRVSPMGQEAQQTTPMPQTTLGRLRAPEVEQAKGEQQAATSAPSSTTTTTTTAKPTTTTTAPVAASSPATSGRLAQSSQQAAMIKMMMMSSLAPNAVAATTTTTTTIATPTTTAAPPTTDGRVGSSSTIAAPKTSATSEQQSSITPQTMATSSPAPRAADNQQGSSPGQANNADVKPPARPQTKTSQAKFANLTSSFIPTKLRNDFASRLSGSGSGSAAAVAPTTTTAAPQQRVPAPDMSAAIRQFGGANRMSALAQQPVAFGRPAAMTMQQQQQQPQQPARIPVPTFEYGPSIAVRRPDEPLASGQVPNCTLTGKNFCVLTKDYPMNEVRQAVERSFRSVRIMYEELQTVSDQELHRDDFNATNNQAATGKFACQTQVEMMRPGWAKDEITKEWMLVVNTDVFPQRVRTESCAQPNTPCEFIAPFYDSTCQQRYSLHRMIAIDPHDPSRSPQVAVFKFPAGCVCRVHPIRKSSPATTMSPVSPASSTTSATPPVKRRRRRQV